jgi:hypothetical protein
MGPFDKLEVGFSVCGAENLCISKFLASMYVDRPNIFKLMHHGSSWKVSKQSLCPFRSFCTENFVCQIFF